MEKSDYKEGFQNLAPSMLHELHPRARSHIALSLVTFIAMTAFPRSEAMEVEKTRTVQPIQCTAITLPQGRSLNRSEAEAVNNIISHVEALEEKGLFAEAASQYSRARKLIVDAEGECTINSGRFRLVYGTKLFRAFRLQEAEVELGAGLGILRLANNAIKETCQEYAGGLEFLGEIYDKKFDHTSFANSFFEAWPFLQKCLEAQGDATSPALFNIFIRLSSAFFAGYSSSNETDALRQKREELAFDALNKAFSVVNERPTEMQSADLLLKEGYFKYVMAGFAKEISESRALLKRAKEATSQALQIHLKNNEPERAYSSSKQLAYILESLGEHSWANKIYKELIDKALDKPLKAIGLSENHTLLSGYALFTKNWGSKLDFKVALKKLREWESVASKAVLPAMNPTERLEYLHLFSQSEGVASRGLAAGMLSPDEYLDSFLQLRYTLIESELIAVKRNTQAASRSSPSGTASLSSHMSRSDIDYTSQVAKSLGKNEIFVQFVEPLPNGYNSRIAKTEIETRAQAFVVRNGKDKDSVSFYRLCENTLCESLISSAYNSSREGLSDVSEKWSIAMENLFPRELIEVIRGAESVYVGLDGALQRVPIGIIRRHLESVGLDSTRFIVVQNLEDIGGSSRSEGGGASTLFYAPDYGVGPKCGSGMSCSQQWPELPYSLSEGDAISSLLKVNTLVGEQASKSSLMSVKRPRLLHISTHAGFSANAVSVPIADPRALGGLKSLDGLYNLYIAASGANILPPSLSILTYEDLAGLDLQNTSLVVISACETGLGGSVRGYGLFGLHRILASVGAESTLLSMWKVDDEATSVFMKLFYKELKNGSKIDVALARTQDRMMNDQQLKSRGWSHPYYWAGWQLVGKMSPVTGVDSEGSGNVRANH